MHAWTTSEHSRVSSALGWLLAAAMALCSLPVQAHKASDAYLFLASRDSHTTLRWDIALRDLDAVLPLDADGDRNLTWGEVKRAWPRIDALALDALAVPGCRFAVDSHALEQRSDGAYAVLNATAACVVNAQTPVRYSLFQAVDPTHRGLLKLSVDGASPVLKMLVPAVISAADREAANPMLGPAAEPVATVAGQARSTDNAQPTAARGDSPPSPVASTTAAPATAPPVAAPGTPADSHAPAFIREGVHHIVTGYDHLLFLLCLLLPAVLERRDGRWQPVSGWRQALLPVAKTVTLFTLAHSVTLALASLGWVNLSPSLIEPAIAVTIMLAALDNLRPLLLRWRGAVTFGFGLIHGFGFAGVLREMDLPPAQFGWALLQFNLGLELGQLSLVLLVVPLLFVLRARKAYVPGVLGAGSAMAMVVAFAWVIERTSDLRLMPF